MAESNPADQEPEEEQVHIFVIKFWRESGALEHAFWRGHITHIPSSKRVYVQQMAQLIAFIQRYMQLPD